MGSAVIQVEVVGWIGDLLEPGAGVRRGTTITLPVGVDPPCTLWTLLTAVAAQHPRLGRMLLVPGMAAVAEYVNVLVNDQVCEAGAGLDQPLVDGDRVTLLAAYSGG